MKTPTRYIPQNSKPFYRFGVDAVVYVTDSAGKNGKLATMFCAMGYSGARGKADFNHWFRTNEQRAAYITKYFDSVVSREKIRADRKAEQDAKRAAGHGFSVGDVVYTSWGYDQTNVNFFEVVDATSPKSVKLRPIKSDLTETGFMSGNVTPCKGEFSGDEFRAIFNGNGIKADGHHASKWNGEPKHCSWYA